MAANNRVDSGRMRNLRGGEAGAGPVLYWMRREQRVNDNWALLQAQDMALELGRPLGVVFCLAPKSAAEGHRHDWFILTGLRQAARALARLKIPFFLLEGDPVREIPAFGARFSAACLVTDCTPLRSARSEEDAVCERIKVPVVQVDAHNVVPVWSVSGKQELAARTLRPKLRRLLPRYLTELPAVRRHPRPWREPVAEPDWDATVCRRRSSTPKGMLRWCEPGEAAAQAALRRFLDERLAAYDVARNDPTVAGQSDLSPYLHSGQLAPQRVALAAAQRPEAAGREAFLEELLVRRELSDNFCHFNPNYDDYEGLPAWGRRTLEDHLGDRRERIYSLEQFAAAATHEQLWNAAQTELVVRGKLPGYLRMYWAKKILEWTPDPAVALDIANTLNDRYSLDGRDPNGYVGCAWAIGGLHDRPWAERPVFGKIRYMNLAGCRRKFRVERYLERVARLLAEAEA